MYGIYCTKAQECEAAWGLSAINAMHSKCVWYNYLYPVGIATMDTLKKLEFQKYRLRDKPILHKMALQGHSSSRSARMLGRNHEWWVWSKYIGSILIDYAGYHVIRWCYKHHCYHQAWTRETKHKLFPFPSRIPWRLSIRLLWITSWLFLPSFSSLYVPLMDSLNNRHCLGSF